MRKSVTRIPPGPLGSGAPYANAGAYVPSSAAGAPMTDQNRPWFSVPKIRPACEEMMIWFPLIGLTVKLEPTLVQGLVGLEKKSGHWMSWVVTARSLTDCKSPKVRVPPLTWKKLVEVPESNGTK